MHRSRRVRPRILPVPALLACALLLISAPAALALDCTPLATLSLDGTTTGALIGDGAVPGEPACGTDYTGQDFHVYEFTLTEPTQVVFLLATGGQPFGSPPPDAELFVLSSCDPNACVATYAGQGGATSDPVCLPGGTYTLVVASPDAGGTNQFGTAVAAVGSCDPVGNEAPSWSGLKGRF